MDNRDLMNNAVAEFVTRTVSTLDTENTTVELVEALTGLIKVVNNAPMTVTLMPLEDEKKKSRWSGIIPNYK